ncbi:uncharacterized protein NPIL_355251 [Nephila pilipes]|uniref:Uncharacterized protein n=1 Tax=Nephila pilipes TaxID=299642 RepID=A0A8X6ULG7_NEPPI|nr:uncharacterized protein NPIL_355251 [Nephila pilipes]
MHGGVQLIHSAMKQKYWIVGAKTAIRRELRLCVTCARFSSEFSKQIMADLPTARVSLGRALLKGGMDFAGPSLITPRHDREIKAIRMHVCAFVFHDESYPFRTGK